ncbi:triose-phosphate isomerase [Campylobacter sp. 19-13652]|uniref:triose-phosphate isomerase n=1 Tax=Campylobacter sp. 19-13652 TaxID=2840180 RepID=UPI001C84F706
MAIRTMASLVQDKGATSGADSAASKFNSLNVIVAAPAACFCKVSGFELAAQNFYPAANGSFTGETGAEMLAEWGIKSVIVGHSERRMLGESEEFLRSKFDFAAKRGWRVIYCIGESLSEYESGASAEVLGALASNIDLRYSNLILAYEPIFSIGTGVSASVEHIGKMLSHLHTLTPAPLLYGGSVSAKNVSEIVGVANCDGVLVGTASWELEGFKALIEAGLKI